MDISAFQVDGLVSIDTLTLHTDQGAVRERSVRARFAHGFIFVEEPVNGIPQIRAYPAARVVSADGIRAIPS